MTEALIHLDALQKTFNEGAIIALKSITATINGGCITGLVGPDGAGKTTLIRLLSGLMLPSQGSVTLCGLDPTKDSEAIQDFIGYMPQKFGLYEELTVQENLNLYARLRGVAGTEKKVIFEKMLEFTQLGPFTNRMAKQLSGGMKQKLGLACALLSHPKILLLDEPSVGVDPISRQELWKMVQALMREGMAIIWATSYLDEAENCHEVLLLNKGELLFAGPPHRLTARVENRVYQITADNQPRQQLSSLLQQRGVLDGVIMGRRIRLLLAQNAPLPSLPLTPITPRFEDAFVDILKGDYVRYSMLAEQMQIKTKEGPIPIEATNLTKKFGDFIAAQNISFKVNRGEIFGLLGPNGAGKSTTFKMLCGLLQPTSGNAAICGVDLKGGAKVRSRIGYMAQKFSLYSDLSVYQNLVFFSGIYGLKGKKRNKKIQEMIQIFDLKTYHNTNAGLLPLGFKQRLALACAVMHEPDVLFLDEPTSGVDPLTRREFWIHINAMVEKGVAIMITTHFMDEAEYCDNIALIYNGKNIASGTPDELKARIRTPTLTDPTLEDAFIELIKRQTVALSEGMTA